MSPKLSMPIGVLAVPIINVNTSTLALVNISSELGSLEWFFVAKMIGDGNLPVHGLAWHTRDYPWLSVTICVFSIQN